jgi:hypothetical protein
MQKPPEVDGGTPVFKSWLEQYVRITKPQSSNGYSPRQKQTTPIVVERDKPTTFAGNNVGKTCQFLAQQES